MDNQLVEVDLKAFSPKQIALLDVAREAALQQSVTAMCLTADVSTTAFYNWMQDDANFRLAWEELPRKMLAKHLPGVMSAALRKALDGDVSAIRIILEAANILPKAGTLKVGLEGKKSPDGTEQVRIIVETGVLDPIPIHDRAAS